VTVADAGTVGRTRVARILTEVFAPPILVVALLVVVGIHSTSSVSKGLLLSAVAAFFAAGLPYAIMLIGIRKGRLSDRHLSLREQRPTMMIIGLVSVSVGLLVIVWLDAPREFLALVAAMVAGVGVALAISLSWKISIHTACAAGTVAILVIVFGLIMLVLVPVVVAVCWARVALHDHTGWQVLAGAAVGAIVAATVMSALL
jgi:drug/metabolite transporter (DMT)-like permease